MKQDYSAYTSKLHYFYLEFLSRSPLYQEWLKGHASLINELKETPLKLIPAKIVPGKKSKPVKPDEINKPEIFSKVGRNNQCIWNITDDFLCDSNRVVLEVDIEKPIEILEKQFKKMVSIAQENYWKEMHNENWYGEYRYLMDFKRDLKGRKDTYPFEEWERYLKVYDLRIEGELFKEIAQRIYGSKNENDIDNVKKAFKKAKVLISAAEENKFPPVKRHLP